MEQTQLNLQLGAITFDLGEGEERMVFSVQEASSFRLYKSETLQDVWDTIDENPSDHEDFDLENALSEVETEEDYEEFLEGNLGGKAASVVRQFLTFYNNKMVSQCEDGVVCGEDPFFDMIEFNEENHDENVAYLKKLQEITEDPDGLLQNILEEEDWTNYSDVFYVVKFSTNVP